jgi:hypothetical protein
MMSEIKSPAVVNLSIMNEIKSPAIVNPSAFQRRPKGIAVIVNYYSSKPSKEISFNSNRMDNKSKRILELDEINKNPHFLRNQMTINTFKAISEMIKAKSVKLSEEFELLGNSNILKMNAAALSNEQLLNQLISSKPAGGFDFWHDLFGVTKPGYDFETFYDSNTITIDDMTSLNYNNIELFLRNNVVKHL